MNALKMIIIPLIVSSIIVGVAGIGGQDGLARMGGRTILYYATTSLFAILIGLFFLRVEILVVVRIITGNLSSSDSLKACMVIS